MSLALKHWSVYFSNVLMNYVSKGGGSAAGLTSLTQLYSVDFSQSRIGAKKCVFNNCIIKVCVGSCQRCPGTSAPSAAHLTVSLYLCSSGSNARGKSRALEGRRVSSKSLSRVQDGDEGVAGRNGREWCFPNEGLLICPPGKSMIFHKREIKKIELVARLGSAANSIASNTNQSNTSQSHGPPLNPGFLHAVLATAAASTNNFTDNNNITTANCDNTGASGNPPQQQHPNASYCPCCRYHNNQLTHLQGDATSNRVSTLCLDPYSSSIFNAAAALASASTSNLATRQFHVMIDSCISII